MTETARWRLIAVFICAALGGSQLGAAEGQRKQKLQLEGGCSSNLGRALHRLPWSRRSRS